MSMSSWRSAVRAVSPVRIVEFPAVVVLIVMMLHVTANALSRTVFHSPIQNTIEIVQYIYLPIIAALGFIAAQLRGEHIVADIAVSHLSVSVRRGVLVGGYVVCAVIMAGFCWYGLPEAVDAHRMGKTAGVSDVAAWPIYYLVAIAMGVLAVLFLRSAWRAFRGLEDARDEGADEMIEHTLEEVQ